MKIKHIISVLLILVFALFMFGCSENKVSKNEAKEQASALVNAVSAGNFADAEKLLHPSRQIDLEAYFNREEAEENVDFQSGIEIVKYTGFSSALYDSEVDGSEYELEMNISVSGKTLELKVDVVRNDQGFGIYEIDIDD